MAQVDPANPECMTDLPPARPRSDLPRRCLVGLWVLWHVLGVAAAAGQPGEAAAPPGRVGLVLSGGGAKGFAHVGVINVLAEAALPVDLIVGTSMGAAIGGIYAAGYSADELEAIALEQPWQEIFVASALRRLQGGQQRIGAREAFVTLPLENGGIGLPRGLISGQLLSDLLFRLTLPVHGVSDFSALPIPFAAVATGLAEGETVRLTEGYLPWAIRASIAIPSIFTPVEYAGRSLVDGGVTRPLPATDALDLGADFLICVDVSNPIQPVDSLNTFADVVWQAVGFNVDEELRVQQALCDVLIEPDVDPFDTFSYGQVAELIARGERAARAVLPVLLERLGRTERPHRYVPDYPEAVLIREVRVEGLPPGLERYVRRALALSPPALLTVEALDRAVARIYETDFFRHVIYRLLPEGPGEGRVLVVRAEPGYDRWLGLGLRYGSRYHAAVFLTALLRNQLGMGSDLNVDVRLGEHLQARARVTAPFAPASRVMMRAGVSGVRATLDLTGADGVFSEQVVTAVEAAAGLGRSLSPSLFDARVLWLQLRGERFDIDEAVGVAGLATGPQTLAAVALHLDAGPLEQRLFATGGTDVAVRAEAVTGAEGGRFAQLIARGAWRRPVTERLSVRGRLALGLTYGGGPPLHYRFYLGGALADLPFEARHFPFFGYDVQARSGRSLQAVWLGAQYRLWRRLFVQARWNAARLHSTLPRLTGSAGVMQGGGLVLGAPTPVGPVAVAVSAPGLDGPYALSFSVGYTF